MVAHLGIVEGVALGELRQPDRLQKRKRRLVILHPRCPSLTRVIRVSLPTRFSPAPFACGSWPLVLVSLMALRDRVHVDFRTARFSVAGAVVGSILGARLVSALDPRGFGLLFGVLVLLGVALSLAGYRLALNRRSAFGAGVLGGFMSATSSVGGPPMALVYQHEDPGRFRGTLATYFIASCSVSLAALTAFGAFDLQKLSLAAYLVPGQVLGFLLSFWVSRFLVRGSLRPFILGLSALAASVVLLRMGLT